MELCKFCGRKYIDTINDLCPYCDDMGIKEQENSIIKTNMNKTKIGLGVGLFIIIVSLVFLEREITSLREDISKLNEEVYGTQDERVLLGLTDEVSKIDNLKDEIYGTKESRTEKKITDERISLIDLVINWINNVSQSSQNK